MAAKSNGQPPPPLEKVFYTVNEVCALVNLSRQQIHRMEHDGDFPQRVQISQARVGFYVDEIKAWIASRPRVARRAIDADIAAAIPIKRASVSLPESQRR